MPRIGSSPDGGPVTKANAFEQVFGIPSPPPPPPVAQPTLGAAPTVSPTPAPGQGIALDAAGRLNVASTLIPVFAGDPSGAKVGAIWYRSDTKQISIQHDSSTVVRVTLA